MRRPLLYPLIALIAGILIGDRIALPVFYVLPAVLTVLILLLLSVRNNWDKSAFILILVFMGLVGLFNIQRQQDAIFHHHHIVHQTDQGPLTIEGIVLASDPSSLTNNVLVVRCRRKMINHTYIPVTGDIRLVIPSDLHFQYGDFIRFHCRIKKIQSFYNPGSFDYKRFLNRRGIYVSGFLSNPASIVLIRHDAANSIRLKLEIFRSHLKQLIYSNASSPEREIIEAMTIGNQNAIPRWVLDNFAKTGTSHILSISGLHVGMVAAGCFFLIFLLMKSSEYLMLKFNIIKLATALSFLPVIIYTLVSGMGTPVIRSALMALAFFTALLAGKQKDMYNILFGAAFIILIVVPESLFEISFQLSFCAVFGLVYMVPKFGDIPTPYLSSMPHFLQGVIRRAFIFVLVSAAATLATLPIIVFYFNRVSAVTLIANLITVPLLGILALIPAMASILISIFSPGLAGLLIKTAAFFTHISVEIINRLASLPWSSFHIIKPSIPEIILFYIMLFLLIEMLTPKNKIIARGFPARHPSLIKAALLISATLILADGAYLAVKDKYATDLKITAIDVGQGASTLVQMPRGINMLIDGGGFHDSSFDMGRFVVAPFLYAKRLTKLDIVVLTHPHPDHLQGLIYILDNFDVREVWWTGWKSDDDLFRLFEKTIHNRKIKVRHVSSLSSPENISGVLFNFLWPPHSIFQNQQMMSYDETNDHSLVFKIIFGTTSFLVTGDISSDVESLLIQSGRNLKSDLLFAPHHGSIHSSSVDFIHAVSCRYAVISSGKNNIFRHPHPDVLNRYTSSGVAVFRTDQNGAISIHSDGKTIKIIPWLERPAIDHFLE